MGLDLSEKILAGLALGDQIGGPTALATLCAKHIQHGTPEELEELAGAYYDYYVDGSFDSGPVFESVHSRIQQGVDRTSAVRDTHDFMNGQTAGCNPLHRSICLAGKLDLDEQSLITVVRQEALLTHHDPLAGDAAVVGALICRRLLEQKPMVDCIKQLINKSMLKDYANEPLSSSGFAPSTLFAALHFASDSEHGLRRAFAFAGNENYCPPIVGAIQACLRYKKVVQ